MKVRASSREVSNATVMVTARARKKLPGDLGHGDQGKKDNDRCDGGKDQRPADFVDGLANRRDPGLSCFAVNGNILDYYDGIIDDQPDGGGQTAQGHQVEALPGDAQRREWSPRR